MHLVVSMKRVKYRCVAFASRHSPTVSAGQYACRLDDQKMSICVGSGGTICVLTAAAEARCHAIYARALLDFVGYDLATL